MINPLGDLAQMKPKITKKIEVIPHLLNYAATHPNVKIRYCKSVIILHIQSNGSYPSFHKAQRYIIRHFFLSEKNLPQNLQIQRSHPHRCKNPKTFRRLNPYEKPFINHKQPPTTTQVDNYASVGFLDKKSIKKIQFSI